MFKIFKDKDRVFKCTLDVLGARIDECKARLIFEFNDQIVMYKGVISDDGQCKVIIPKAKKFNEGDSGRVILEVIAENTFFESWSSDFEVSLDKKVSIVIESSENGDIDDKSKQSEGEINNKKVSVHIEDDEDNNNESIISKNPSKAEDVSSDAIININQSEIEKEDKILEIKSDASTTNKQDKQIYNNEGVLDFEHFLKNK